jgi:hypothetical protein
VRPKLCNPAELFCESAASANSKDKDGLELSDMYSVELSPLVLFCSSSGTVFTMRAQGPFRPWQWIGRES